MDVHRAFSPSLFSSSSSSCCDRDAGTGRRETQGFIWPFSFVGCVSYKVVGVEGAFHASMFIVQTEPHVRNFSARKSGAGNGCANSFLGSFCWKTHAHKFLFLGGGGLGFFFFLKGGVEVPILFLWAWDFLNCSTKNVHETRAETPNGQI